MKQKPNYGSRKQQGIALPIIMIILVLAALVTIYSTTTSVKEQQVAADQYRSEQAFSVAQAGVDVALERHNHFETFTVDGCGNAVQPETAITSNCTDFSGSEKGSFTVMFCDIWEDDNAGPKSSELLMQEFLADTTECENPLIDELDYDEIDAAGNPTPGDGFKGDERVGILSVGKPDDNSGMRVISAVSAPGFNKNDGGLDFVPLTAKGSVAITGNITVINRYKNLNVWSGLDTGSGSNSVESYIKTPGVTGLVRGVTGEEGDSLINADYPTPPNASLASREDLGKNSDVLDNDKNLKEMSASEMFWSLFSTDMNTVKQMAIGIDQHYTNANIGDIEGKTGLLWYEYSGNAPVSFNVGTFDNAAFLIVEVLSGNDPFSINGGTIHGMVFVIGEDEVSANAQMSGNVVVKGSMISTGNVDKSGGTPIIVFDPEGLTISPEGLAGLRGLEPGTWKDWGYVN